MLRYSTVIAFFFFNFMGLTQTSLGFDGTNDYVNCGNGPSVNITGTAITLEAWVYPTSFTTNVWQGNIINKNGTGENGYMLRAGNSGQVNFNIGSTGWNELNTATGTIALNTWHHLAATYDGVEMRIYVDGVLEASAAETVPITATTMNLLLGEDPQWVGRYFPGRIDEVRIWNVARSQVDIQAGMNNEICTTDPSLKAYYRFNGGVAGGNNAGQITLADESGNGNNGTLINFANAGATSNWVTGVTLGAGMTSGTTEVDACNTYTWAANGQTYTTSGLYSVPLTASTGCDSISYLDLSIFSPSNLTTNMTACDQYLWGVSGQTYTASGSYPTSQVTSQGCPYMHTLNLTVNPSYDTTYMVEDCAPYYWPVNGQSYSISGTYTETYATSHGCDSTIALNLNLLPQLNASIQQNSDGSLSTQNFEEIQWLDCNNGMAPIAGATNAAFMPTVNGSYAVMVDGFSECADTSECFTVDYLALPELESFQVTLYPNPTSGAVTVDHAETIASILVSTMDGKWVTVDWHREGDQIMIQLPETPAVYLVEFTDLEGRKSRKSVVKQF